MTTAITSANQKAQAVVDRLLAGRRAIEVLEAGCGSTSHLRVPSGANVTGIDISETQLARNALLQTRICADLQSHRWAESTFDLVVCWDVLEHLPRPRLALRNLHEATASGGVIVLAMPNLYSVKGLVTRFTPFAFHEWFYRYVMGDTSARDEFKQFPTYLKADIAPSRLRATVEGLGLEIVHFDAYEGPVQGDLRRRNRLADWCFALARPIGRALTMGRHDPNLSDMILVLRKP
jgi:2-polyprenyl-3-methyl-5-hydroxy-6-metoxy-1,4-benzoquinol methylase